jgi:hypothetical protein
MLFCVPRSSFAQFSSKYPGWCDRLQHAESSDLVEVLRGAIPDKQNARCVTWAIQRLGSERYQPAIPVLAKLLDFQRPPTELEKTGVFLRMQGMEELFPSAEALEEIGKLAECQVLQVIRSKSASVTARNHAVGVWMEMHKYERPKGVALLKEEANKADTEAVRQKYKVAALWALKYCINDPEYPACETAAKTGRY